MINKNSDIGVLILRITISILMLFHGIAKIGKVEGFYDVMENINLPTFFAYGLYLGEIIVPIVILIGVRTRIAALMFAFTCFVLGALGHGDEFFTLAPHGGWALELLGLYFFGAITLFFTGGGKYAISTSNKWD
ncbi:DoxX family protein [Aquimarina rhabdastrellae]